LGSEQLGEQRSHYTEEHYTDQELDQRKAATDAAMSVVSHVHVVQSTLEVRGFVRRKLAVSDRSFVFVGVIITVTVLTLLTTGSVTVMTRLCGYGPLATLTVVDPVGIKAYGVPSSRFTSFMSTPFLYALPAATIPFWDTEYIRAASDVTATASNTIATMTSTMTKPFRFFAVAGGDVFAPTVNLRNEIFIIG
jgi:hypothetical protein